MSILFPNTMLNLTLMFIFSSLLLFLVSGNDIIKLQEDVIDKIIEDFQLVLSTAFIGLPSQKKQEFLDMIRAQKKPPPPDNGALKKKLYIISASMMLATFGLFVFFGQEIGIFTIVFSISVTVSLFITEVYVYTQIIKPYQYISKSVFYEELFKQLLKDENIQELENNICYTTNEENLVE